MDFEYGLVEIIVIANPPTKMNILSSYSLMLDKMERGLITCKDQNKTQTNEPNENNKTNENWFLTKMFTLINYIRA
jgi:hypothetical protein